MNPMLAALQNQRQSGNQAAQPLPPPASPVPPQGQEQQPESPKDPMEYLNLLNQKLDKILDMLGQDEEADAPQQENSDNGSSND